ncbi:hypothetical protein EVAR_60171_1 [Eumeta japonica]|uniref:BESS domain-containing protein n=1 Tax=Eumeta variegata TaxID=151549 RepID=A0A4C1Z543_EUMVA|nr:hypothetical protein EVAR_60171_1 [Eumeta japonica]
MEECATGAIFDIQSDGENTPPKQDSRHSSFLCKKGAKAQNGNTDFNEELLDILCEKKEQNFDEDVSFAEMLIPMLRKLNEEQKLYAKVELLNAMHRTKRYDSVSQPLLQTVPQPIHPSHMLALPMYPNTRAKHINAEPGTSSASNFVTPRNIVIHSNKTITKQPRVQENCNDYLEHFVNVLQSTESVDSLNSENYYDVTLAAL